MQARLPAGERAALGAASLVAGLLIAQQVAGRAVRDALFLSAFSVSSLSGMMLASSLVSVGGALSFAAVLARRSPIAVLTGALATQAAFLVAEWRLAAAEPRLVAAALYVQLALLGPGIVSGFWSLVGERFDPHTARRVMGRIGTGASVGGVVGGALAWAGARVLPVGSLLAWLAAASLLALVVLPRLRPDTGPREGGDKAEGGVMSGLRSIRQFPYLRQLAWIVALGALADVLLDYLLKAGAARAIGDAGELARFFSLFYACVALGTLALQAGATRLSLERVGLSGTVSLQPAVVALASLGGLASPSLGAAVVARGFGSALRDSLFRSGYELLYTPLPPWQKRASKALVDVAADKAGALIGAGLVMGLAAQRVLSDRWLWLPALLAMLASVLLTRRLHRGYVGALEQSLRSGLVTLEPEDVVDSTTRLTLTRTSLDRESLLAAIRALDGQPAPPPAPAPSADPLLQLRDAVEAARPEGIRTALLRVEYADPATTRLLVSLLAREELLPDVLRALRRIAPRITDQLIGALLDPRQPARVRRRIPRVLKASVTSGAVDGLVRGLQDTDFAVRRACGAVLAWMRERHPGLAVPAPAVYAAVERELGGTVAQPDAQLGHVFALVSLVGESEPLRAARWAVVGGDARLRGTALEYLEQVLPVPVRQALLRRLGALAPAPAPPRALDEVEEDLRRSAVSLPRGWSTRRRRP